jgi:hypothetical protein
MAGALYASVFGQVWGGGINFASDTIKAALATATYTPDSLTHQFFSSVTYEVVGSKTTTLTVANSWGTSRAASTAYVVGDVVRPATGNGWLYQCVAAGTTGAGLPTYPTVVGQTVVDGTVTWVNVGRAVFVLDFADPQWASATITGRTIVLYKSTGTAATSPLIGYDTLAADVASTNGTWTYQVDAKGFGLFFVE